MKTLIQNIAKLSLLVGVFSLFLVAKPVTAASDISSVSYSAANTLSALENIAVTDNANLDDHHCHRRCEEHYRHCKSSCPHHGHHGHYCQDRCEKEYRHCKHHCGHH